MPHTETCGKVQFAVIDVIETNCLEGINDRAFLQKVAEKLADGNLVFASPGTMRPYTVGDRVGKPIRTVDILLSHDKVPADEAPSVMETHIAALQSIRDWWPEISDVDISVSHLVTHQPSGDESLRFAFAAYDKDNSGKLSADELKAILTASHTKHGAMSDDDTAVILADADTSGDGEIDIEEFITLMSKPSTWVDQ